MELQGILFGVWRDDGVEERVVLPPKAYTHPVEFFIPLWLVVPGGEAAQNVLHAARARLGVLMPRRHPSVYPIAPIGIAVRDAPGDRV